MTEQARPNILFIMTDQQYAGAMSCAGNDYLSTPAMDSLADTGILFKRTYCAYPICIPSRESILTGRMPHEIGYTQWGDPIAEHFKPEEMGIWFRKAGYECVYGGKLHAPDNDASKHGFEALSGHDDNRLADACVAYLKRDHTRPFLMIASFDNPHNICEWARHQNLPWGEVPESALEDCPDLPPNFHIPPYEPEVIRLIQRNFPHVYLPQNNTADEWRQYRHAYYRLIEKVDAEIMKILDALRQTGLDDNTLIAFTSDHGDGHGAHQWNQKSILYEESVRVPLILSFKGRTLAGVQDDNHLVSNGLDLFPTFCDYAAVEPPNGLPGGSLRSLAEGGTVEHWREALFVETWPFQGDPHPTGTKGRMVRTDRYKYIVYSWGRYREQLFDLETDPGEMVNLAVQSKFRSVLEQHRELLRSWCRSTGDDYLKHIPVNRELEEGDYRKSYLG